MRLWLVVCCLTLCVGCAGPHSTGALWAQQNLEQEGALFRLTDAQRAESARGFETGLADEALTNERARLVDELQVCAGPLQTLDVSVGDRMRDTIRLRVQGDVARGTAVAQLALADWRLRRARATGSLQFCASAQAALAGEAAPAGEAAQPAAGGLQLSTQPSVTVSRDPRQATAALDGAESPSVAISDYALGYVDAVRAPSPLPQYLALVYGGYVLDGGGMTPSLTTDQTAADLVDRYASAYPEWEPDALYAALRGVGRM
jgi:hypothetical protein